MTLVKAWAVLTPQQFRNGLRKALSPYGNGSQYQYPIFPTRKEAEAWRDEDRQNRGRVQRVEMRVI